MIKPLLLASFMLSCSFASALNPNLIIVDRDRKAYNEVDQDYDYMKGWWWYQEDLPEEEVEEEKEKREKLGVEEPVEKTIKYKVEPAQKLQMSKSDAIIALLQKQVEQQAIQNELLKRTTIAQERIVAILEYEYPRRTPEYTKNKKTGEECLTNSDADCFVQPVIPEFQQVPVMRDFLRTPTLANAKKYLKWQATYFNHNFDIGYALSFAHKQGGKEAYPVDNMLTNTTAVGSMSDYNWKVKHATIQKLGKNLAVKLFVGKNAEMEKIAKRHHIKGARKGVMRFINNYEIVYLDEKTADIYENKVPVGKEDQDSFNRTNRKIAPEEFKQFNVTTTPTVMVIYTDPKSGKQIWQKLGINFTSSSLVERIYGFLTYHRIINPGNSNPELYNKVQEQGLPGGKYDLRGMDIDINENPSFDKIPEDQILKKEK